MSSEHIVEHHETSDGHPDGALATSRMIVEAWLQTVGREEGARFLKNLGVVLANQEEMSCVVPIRRTAAGKAAARAERDASSALRQMLPVFIARLPPE